MTLHDPNEINRLIGEFMDLQEVWQQDPGGFEWESLRALAHKGAHAYNEGAGPSFHSLVLDGVEHGQLHERFLEASIEAGFDPFRLTHAGTQGGHSAPLPVIDHADLALTARSNPSSARMLKMLKDLARSRFAALVQEPSADAAPDAALMQAVIACAESIPLDMLERIAPELAESQRRGVPPQRVDPIEGFLSTAEVRADRSSEIYG
jgi:hypothetical protein